MLSRWAGACGEWKRRGSRRAAEVYHRAFVGDRVRRRVWDAVSVAAGIGDRGECTPQVTWISALAAGASSRRPRSSSDGQTPGAKRGKGASQAVYVLEAGKPRAVSIKTGVSNGTMTEVLSGDLKPGMQVITGKLAAKTS